MGRRTPPYQQKKLNQNRKTARLKWINWNLKGNRTITQPPGPNETDVLANVCVKLLLFRAHELSVSKQMHPIENEKCPYKNSKLKKNESASNWYRRREWNCIRVRGDWKRQESCPHPWAERVDDGWSWPCCSSYYIHASALNSRIDSGITEWTLLLSLKGTCSDGRCPWPRIRSNWVSFPFHQLLFWSDVRFSLQ
jgi:hypothetical protein